jgi:predicted AAA+ superfamily ATPase
MITRDIRIKFKKWLKSDEILIIYGPRQVGKTTFLNQMFSNKPDALIFNCELNNIKQILESRDLEQIKILFGNKKYIALDEAQSVLNIGLLLKTIFDEFKGIYKMIVTGSSSFDLSNNIIEPLTGRNIKFRMLPLSINELYKEKGWLWVKDKLNSLLVYGSYPGTINLDYEMKVIKLLELSSDYLYKDLLKHENIRNSSVLSKLLSSLALQLGSQVSYNELANQVRISQQTVEKYLDLLEKSFVIYSLGSYSTNLRNELRKSRKYYFYDLGIRNALLNNFNPVTNRSDSGALWENFCINEMIKQNELEIQPSKFYFWRTYDGAEIDLIEEKNGVLKAYECKWGKRRKSSLPGLFKNTYHVDQLNILNPENISDYFLSGQK